MYYLCPKCGAFMTGVSTASIPAITRYQCFSCGYVSKPQKEELYTELPKELWSEEKENEI